MQGTRIGSEIHAEFDDSGKINNTLIWSSREKGALEKKSSAACATTNDMQVGFSQPTRRPAQGVAFGCCFKFCFFLETGGARLFWSISDMFLHPSCQRTFAFNRTTS